MTIPLRDRRKQETARDIQRATLRLAIRHGLENVTTEAIAQAVGISARTFFNYYENKVAAAVGTPPGFCAESLEELRSGTGPLARDIRRLLERHVSMLAEDLEVLSMVRQVVHASPAARSVLDRVLHEQGEVLAGCLSERVGDRDVGTALADGAVRCTARAILLWENDKARTLHEALNMTWDSQVAASRILAREAD